jgi:putative redox protein
MIEINLERKNGDFGFEATDQQGHSVMTDASADIGGQNTGARPMQLMLMALGSCSAIDVVNILKKQRQTIEGFKMNVSGEREQGVEPSLWKKAHIVFEIKGPVDQQKAERACSLSIEKYCSVAETMRRAGAEITWEVKVIANNVTVH